MADTNITPRPAKSPGLAGFLSIFPGIGTLYAGNMVKGISYILVFAGIIVLLVNARNSEEPIFGVLLAAFYIYQIIDSYNEARASNERSANTEDSPAKTLVDQQSSLFSAILIMTLGVLFLLANLDVLTFRQIGRMWPLILIILGIKIVFNHYERKEENGHE